MCAFTAAHSAHWKPVCVYTCDLHVLYPVWTCLWTTSTWCSATSDTGVFQVVFLAPKWDETPNKDITSLTSVSNHILYKHDGSCIHFKCMMKFAVIFTVREYLCKTSTYFPGHAIQLRPSVRCEKCSCWESFVLNTSIPCMSVCRAVTSSVFWAFHDDFSDLILRVPLQTRLIDVHARVRLSASLGCAWKHKCPMRET